MELNHKKSHAMIFNFTKDWQFTSRTKMGEDDIDVVKETKLLGVIVNDIQSWDGNTSYLIKRANSRNSRMRLSPQIG